MTKTRHCQDCGTEQEVVDEFEEQVGYEEQARPVYVFALECGHDEVQPIRAWRS